MASGMRRYSGVREVGAQIEVRETHGRPIRVLGYHAVEEHFNRLEIRSLRGLVERVVYPVAPNSEARAQPRVAW